MTVGDGILWSTILVLASLAVYQASIRHKWKQVGTGVLVLAFLVSIVATGVWAWARYQDRPRPVSTLGGIRLGMSPLEVKLAKGNPKREISGVANDKEPRLGWLFGSDGGDDQIVVIFSGASTHAPNAEIVCQRGGYESLLDLGRFSSEQDVVSRGSAIQQRALGVRAGVSGVHDPR